MAKEILYRGMTGEDFTKMSLTEFATHIKSRPRRSLTRGFTDDQKKLLEKINNNDKDLKTHSRDMVIIPAMLGKTIKIYNGKEFMPVIITEEMLGHYLGEFALTRRRVAHNAPGVGATRSELQPYQ